MTTEKLTARLSDGTEWEFTRNPEETFDKSSWVAWLRPLKPSPPKEVWVMTGPDGKKDLYTYEHNALFNQGPRDSIARYLLTPEPAEALKEKANRLCAEVFDAENILFKSPKPAREWWCVTEKQYGAVYGSFKSEEEARSCRNCYGHPSLEYLEIVHVREVVSDGK